MSKVVPFPMFSHIYIYTYRDSRLNRPESGSLALLARQYNLASLASVAKMLIYCSTNGAGSLARMCGDHPTEWRMDIVCGLSM